MTGKVTPVATPLMKRRWQWAAPYAGLAGAATAMILRDLRAGHVQQAVIEGGIVVVTLAVFCAVELLLSGRVRLWTRVAEASVIVGALLFVSWLGGVALRPALIIWLVFTGGLVALAWFKPEVTT